MFNFIVWFKFSLGISGNPSYSTLSPALGFRTIFISQGVTTTSFSRMCLLVPATLCLPYGSMIHYCSLSISLYALASSVFSISFSPTVLVSFVSAYMLSLNSCNLSLSSSSPSMYSSMIFSTSSHFFSFVYRKCSFRSSLSCSS